MKGIASLVLFASTFAYAGNEAGNGGGLAEQNVNFAFLNLGRYASICLNSAKCGLTSEERRILASLVANHASEVSLPTPLKFLSERENPGTFLIDGAARVAKTSLSVGSAIFFNLDLLYARDSSGQLSILDIPSAVGIFVHELGHHQGERDHQKLTLLGAKVESLLRQNVRTLDLVVNRGSVIAIDDSAGWDVSKPISGFPQLIFSDADSVFDLSAEVKNHLGRDVSEWDLLGANFSNFFLMHGSSVEQGTALKWIQPVRAWVRRAFRWPESGGGAAVGVEVGHELQINFVFERKDEVLRFSPEKTTYQFIDCANKPDVWCKAPQF